jgi:hypothetical protein
MIYSIGVKRLKKQQLLKNYIVKKEDKTIGKESQVHFLEWNKTEILNFHLIIKIHINS